MTHVDASIHHSNLFLLMVEDKNIGYKLAKFILSSIENRYNVNCDCKEIENQLLCYFISNIHDLEVHDLENVDSIYHQSLDMLKSILNELDSISFEEKL
ncbi:MAG: hypothetical protein ACXAC2_01135 [Candidatus Kariarchaeaceae archaeon]|jgi:hypothetical protein